MEGLLEAACSVPQRGKGSAGSTGTAVEVEQIAEGCRGQAVVKNFLSDHGIATLPPDPEIAVGSLDYTALGGAVAVGLLR